MQAESNLASQVYDCERNVHDCLMKTITLFNVRRLRLLKILRAEFVDQYLRMANSENQRMPLNAIPGVNLVQRNFIWYLNGKEWDGVAIKERYKPSEF